MKEKLIKLPGICGGLITQTEVLKGRQEVSDMLKKSKADFVKDKPKTQKIYEEAAKKFGKKLVVKEGKMGFFNVKSSEMDLICDWIYSQGGRYGANHYSKCITVSIS
jgi:hypothetical protein